MESRRIKANENVIPINKERRKIEEDLYDPDDDHPRINISFCSIDFGRLCCFRLVA